MAPAYIAPSMIRPLVGFMANVAGTMSATPMVAESPGSAPMMMPPARPAIIKRIFNGSNRLRIAGKMNSVMRNVLSKRCSAPLP